MTDKQVKQLAEGLSEAQKRAVLSAKQTQSGHWYLDTSFAIEQSLRAKGLGKTVGNLYFTVTRKCLPVRQYLKDNQHG